MNYEEIIKKLKDKVLEIENIKDGLSKITATFEDELEIIGHLENAKEVLIENIAYFKRRKKLEDVNVTIIE